MRKPILTSIALGVLALALSACDISAVPYAAKVGGVTIPASRLNSVLEAFSTNSGLRCIFAEQGAVNGAGNGTFSSTFTTQRLTEVIELQLENSLVAQLHLKANAYATSLATQQAVAAFGPSSVGNCTTSGQQFLNSIAPSYKSVLLGLETDQVLLDAHLAGAQLSASGIASYERGHKAEMTLSCISAIEVASQQKALQLATEIKAGASFAKLAEADSTDSGSAASGGAIGCVVLSDLLPPLNQAAASLGRGQLSAPVAFSGSWVLLEITSQQGLAPVAQAEQAIFDSENTAANALTSAYAAKTGVEVNPEYGRWTGSKANAEVKAPAGPSNSLLLNPSAITPVAAG